MNKINKLNLTINLLNDFIIKPLNLDFYNINKNKDINNNFIFKTLAEFVSKIS